MRTVFALLLVLPVVVYCCDETTHYMKDGECCKMCGPGTRMKQNTDCNDPFCQQCEEGEYQTGYTKETKCQRQPICDINLNFLVPSERSKMERQPCLCMSDHHCSSEECISCVPNKVCQPGQKIVEKGTMKTDIKCGSCPPGTFSSATSANNCTPWTECTQGHLETVKGSSTSDRICEPHSNLRLGIGISALVIIFVVIVIAAICCYKRGKTGSVCLEKKLQHHCPVLFNGINNNPQPAVLVTVEQEPLCDQQNVNVPQEDTEDLAKQDDQMKYGLSANGMPIDQDHSKISVLSQPETNLSAQSFTDHL
ncbi:tumor necrosis factor receptor superfamily member 5 [Salminus brasiliensis]|uniref:tumor necrosis factor receptor superfamily member 5 n=1 Tax=Salminus brasiliensis TaxID=930266 RepID=UPI003B832ABD